MPNFVDYDYGQPGEDFEIDDDSQQSEYVLDGVLTF